MWARLALDAAVDVVRGVLAAFLVFAVALGGVVAVVFFNWS